MINFNINIDCNVKEQENIHMFSSLEGQLIISLYSLIIEWEKIFVKIIYISYWCIILKELSEWLKLNCQWNVTDYLL